MPPESRTAYLDGSTRDRGGVIDEFRNGTAPVFLISLKAGGFGLNLTEADYVFLLDPWWNPAGEEQAIDRTHRIGQDKNVMVYRMVAADTIEEKVLALQGRKAAPLRRGDRRRGALQLRAHRRGRPRAAHLRRLHTPPSQPGERRESTTAGHVRFSRTRTAAISSC